MPTANIANATGKVHRIYYADTGPVPGSNDYHTIFFHHGSGVSGEIFKRILPLASKHKLRFVAPNRRDYVNSDKYSEEEAQELKQGKNIFLENLAVELSNFWVWFIDEHNIPKLSDDKKRGGVTIVGWSMGNAASLSPFGQPEVVAPDVYKKLESYIKTLVLYDPPPLAQGFDLIDLYNPFADTEFLSPPDVYRRHVLTWKTSYYVHKPGVMEGPNLDSLDPRKLGDRCSFEKMTEEDKELIFRFESAFRSDIGYQDYDVTKPILKQQAHKALFDEEVVARVLPDIKVVQIGCGSSTWHSVWTYGSAIVHYRKLISEGKRIRPTKFVVFPGMHHFAHWDEPERYVDLLLDAIEYP